MTMMDVAVDAVRIRQGHREELPEAVAVIADSIRQIGLTSPIAVRRVDGEITLIAGRQRLAAHRQLGLATVRAIVFDDDEIQAQIREFDENLCRAELSPAEEALAHHERKQLWESLHPTAKQGAAPARREKGSKGGKAAKFATLPQSYTAEIARRTGKAGRTTRLNVQRGRSLSGDILGKVRGTSLDKGEQLDALVKIQAMPGGAPLVAKLVDSAIAGKKVDAKTELRKESRIKREHDLAGKIEDFDEQRFGVLLVDPPWARETWSEVGKSRDPSNHYPTQAEEYLSTLEIPAAPDCILFLWSTQEHLAQAMRLIEAWGFTYKSGAVWLKPKISTGYWFRTKHELVLVATKGHPVAPAPGTQLESVFAAPVGKHSVKPTVVHEMIERLWPETAKLEMFARAARPGWALWGAEAPDSAA